MSLSKAKAAADVVEKANGVAEMIATAHKAVMFIDAMRNGRVDAQVFTKLLQMEVQKIVQHQMSELSRPPSLNSPTWRMVAGFAMLYILTHKTPGIRKQEKPPLWKIFLWAYALTRPTVIQLIRPQIYQFISILSVQLYPLLLTIASYTTTRITMPIGLQTVSLISTLAPTLLPSANHKHRFLSSFARASLRPFVNVSISTGLSQYLEKQPCVFITSKMDDFHLVCLYYLPIDLRWVTMKMPFAFNSAAASWPLLQYYVLSQDEETDSRPDFIQTMHRLKSTLSRSCSLVFVTDNSDDVLEPHTAFGLAPFQIACDSKVPVVTISSRSGPAVRANKSLRYPVVLESFGFLESNGQTAEQLQNSCGALFQKKKYVSGSKI
eukprot:TRINITY_DN20254_c0_g1_i1.p1 TRINITY_DN20254_c0_g1~~TRINITY_DN20254_c0_g1_i1.p1  ORF type:complete len:379 (-),score=76.79 TRINITY_DN20254_c0_g1_i1:240-1376(-)